MQDSAIKPRLTLLQEAALKVHDWDDYALNRYEKFGDDLKKKLHDYSPAFSVLLIDPGLMIRINDFIDFVKSKNLDKNKPWEAREAYSKHLGSQTWYRGLALQKAEFDEIKTVGIQSQVIRNNVDTTAVLTRSLSEQVTDRLRERNKSEDPFMSFTLDYDIARGVPCAFADIGNKDVYVYYIKIPLLDLFATYDAKDWFREGFEKFFRDEGINIAEIERAFFKPSVESFALFQVNVDEFTKIDKMERLTPQQCYDIQHKAKQK